MICKSCGHKPLIPTKYCTACGKKMDKEEMDFRLEESTEVYCNTCGSKTSANYCVECGHKSVKYTLHSAKHQDLKLNLSGQTIKESVSRLKSINISDLASQVKTNLNDNRAYYINMLKYTMVAFAISLLFGFILQFLLFEEINSQMKSSISSMSSELPMLKAKGSVNALDMVQLSNQNAFIMNLKVGGETESDSMGLKIHLSLLFLLLIPILSYLAAGFKIYRNRDKSTREHLKFYALSAFTYAFVLQVLSSLFGKSLSVSNDFLIKIDITMKAGFAFFSGIIISFIIIFIIQVFLSCLLKKERPWAELPLTFILRKTMLVSSLVVLLVLVLGGLGLLGDGYNSLVKEAWPLFILLPNIILYVSVGMFGHVFQMGMDGFALKITPFKISMPSGFDSLGLGSASLQNLILLNLILILTAMIIVFLACRKLSSEKYFLKLAQVALGLGTVHALLVYLASFSMAIKGELSSVAGLLGDITSSFDYGLGSLLNLDMDSQMFLGFKPWTSFIISFLFVMGIGALQFYSRKLPDLGQKVVMAESAILNHNKVAIGVYAGVLGLALIISMNMATKSLEKAIGIDSDAILDSRASERNLFDQRSESSNPFDLNSANGLLDLNDVENIQYADKDNYYLLTNRQVYYYRPSKNDYTLIYEADRTIEGIFVSNDCEKVAIMTDDPSSNASKVIVINKKGVLLSDLSTSAGYLVWSPKDESLLLIGSVTETYHIKDNKLSTIGISSNDIVWESEESLIYMEGSEVMAYRLSEDKSEAMPVEGQRILQVDGKAFILKMLEDEGRLSLNDLEGNLVASFESFTLFPLIIAGESDQYFLIDWEMVSSDIAGDYENISLSTLDKEGSKNQIDLAGDYLLDAKDGKMLIMDSNRGDILEYTIDSNSYRNLFLDFTYSNMMNEEGDQK